MKKRNIMFIVSIILIVALCFAATSAFAVSRTHKDQTSGGTKATAQLNVTRCCTSGKLDSYLRVRGTERLILYPDSATSFRYGNIASGDRTSLTSTASVSNTNYGMIGSAHACYSQCSSCKSSFGSKTTYHHA